MILRERLAHLIAALEAPTVLDGLKTIHNHPEAARRYLGQLCDAIGRGGMGAEAAFAAVATKAKAFDAVLDASGAFPPSRQVTVATRHAAESAMRHAHTTHVGGCSKAEYDLLVARGIGGLAELKELAWKARNVLALGRYFSNDFRDSALPGEALAHRVIEALLPCLSDYWADVMVVDRDLIVDVVGTRHETIWIWTREDGQGTWISKHADGVPDGATKVLRVRPDGVMVMRRQPQHAFAA